MDNILKELDELKKELTELNEHLDWILLMQKRMGQVMGWFCIILAVVLAIAYKLI